MRTNRRRNWFIKRFALGLAIAAVAAPVAQARVDDSGVPGLSTELTTMGVSPSAAGAVKAHQFQVGNVANDQLVSRGRRPTTHDPALTNEVVRAQPQLASRFGRPNATTGDELASWNVNWTDAGIGTGLILALVLLGGGAALASRHLQIGRA
jgi:hypothetical protein